MTKIVGSLFILMISATASANDYLCDYECDGATQKALSIASISSEGTVFTVADIEREEIKTYMVQALAGGWGPPTKVPVLTSTSASKRVQFDELMVVKANFGQEEIVIPSSIAASAYDLTGSSQTQNRVTDWIWSNASLVNKYYAYVASVAAFLGKVIEVNVVLDITFADGSTALVKITGINGNTDVVFGIVPGESRDTDNNTIPDLPRDFNGEYTFQRGMNVDRFVAAAIRSGVQITNVRTCVSTFRVECYDTSSTEQLCLVYRDPC